MRRLLGPWLGLWLGVVAVGHPAGGHESPPGEWQQAGEALYRWRGLIPLYRAVLLWAPGTAPEKVLEDVPKSLEITYLRSLRGDQLAESGTRLLRTQIDETAWKRIRERVERLHGWYGDVREGDRYRLTYRPGLGTELALNGRSLGMIEGADFAQAYFAIWLGNHPAQQKVREQLLGQGTAAGEAARRRNSGH